MKSHEKVNLFYLAAFARLFLAWGAEGSTATVLADDKKVEDDMVTFFMVDTISTLVSSTRVCPAISIEHSIICPRTWLKCRDLAASRSG